MLVTRLKAVKKGSVKIEATLSRDFREQTNDRNKKQKRRGSPEEEEKPRAIAHSGGSSTSQRCKSIRDDCQLYSFWFNKGTPRQLGTGAATCPFAINPCAPPSTRMCASLNPYWETGGWRGCSESDCRFRCRCQPADCTTKRVGWPGRLAWGTGLISAVPLIVRYVVH
jgi:hypothetical protein